MFFWYGHGFSHGYITSSINITANFTCILCLKISKITQITTLFV